jgi:uncharacterized protein
MKNAPIFIDSNVPMYLVGGDHPNKLRARLILEGFAVERVKLVTSVEVFQEICHRYIAIERRDSLAIAFDLLKKLVDRVYPITFEDVVSSRNLLTQYAGLSARDSLHAAVTKNLGISRICSFDSDFDQFPWLARVC